jgi:hypothetical protein
MINLERAAASIEHLSQDPEVICQGNIPVPDKVVIL